MKAAKKRIPVFSTSGDYVIGEIACGEKTLVLGETKEGTVIAYMLGVVKSPYCEELVEAESWEHEVSEKHRLLCYASSLVDLNSPQFVKMYLSMREKIGKNLYGDCAQICLEKAKVGDLVFDSHKSCIGVYIGDGSAIVEDKNGNIARKNVSKLKRAAFGRPRHSSWNDEDVCYSRRLKKHKYQICGDDVRAIQRVLKKMGYKLYSTNGKFDGCTQKAVKQFQKLNSLEPDGVVDYITWKLLMGGD